MLSPQNLRLSTSRNSHSGSQTFTELEFPPSFFSTGRLSIILSFAFSLLTEYQNQVEKKSGKFTQDKLDCYTKKEDPKLLL